MNRHAHDVCAEGVSFEDAASLPLVAHTVWQGLVSRAHLARGERLLVLGGSGGTGESKAV